MLISFGIQIFFEARAEYCAGYKIAEFHYSTLCNRFNDDIYCGFSCGVVAFNIIHYFRGYIRLQNAGDKNAHVPTVGFEEIALIAMAIERQKVNPTYFFFHNDSI